MQDIYGKNGEIPDKWVSRATGWTDEQKREFVIKDNAAFGEWDWNALSNDWDMDQLDDWGVLFPVDWNQESDDNEIPDTDMSIKEPKENFITCPKCNFKWKEK